METLLKKGLPQCQRSSLHPDGPSFREVKWSVWFRGKHALGKPKVIITTCSIRMSVVREWWGVSITESTAWQLYSRHHLPNFIISYSHIAHYCSQGMPAQALLPLCHSFQERLTFLPQTETTRGFPLRLIRIFLSLFSYSYPQTIFLEFLIGCTHFSTVQLDNIYFFLPMSQIKPYIKMCWGYNGINT